MAKGRRRTADGGGARALPDCCRSASAVGRQQRPLQLQPVGPPSSGAEDCCHCCRYWRLATRGGVSRAGGHAGSGYAGSGSRPTAWPCRSSRKSAPQALEHIEMIRSSQLNFSTVQRINCMWYVRFTMPSILRWARYSCLYLCDDGDRAKVSISQCRTVNI